MATAKKLPSGSWRARAFAGRDPVTGKRMFVSFTAPTKDEAELKAKQYKVEQKDHRNVHNLTVSEAVERYITAKAPVLSPSTYREYRGTQRRYFSDIGRKKIHALTTEDMQLFVSGLTLQVSAKTVSNAYGLLAASVAMFRPDAVFRVTLPTKQKKRPISPDSEQIQDLFNAAGPELKVCIALAAFGSLRRGEICALKHKDITGQMAHVHADMVITEDNVFVYKDIPKTSDSNRFVQLPAEVINLIGDGADDAFVVPFNPDQITKRFVRLRKKLGLNSIRFHDLRHYYASIGAVLGIPDTYLAAFGGWTLGSGVMKNVYQNQIESASETYAQTMTEHFSKLING